MTVGELIAELTHYNMKHQVVTTEDQITDDNISTTVSLDLVIDAANTANYHKAKEPTWQINVSF